MNQSWCSWTLFLSYPLKSWTFSSDIKAFMQLIQLSISRDRYKQIPYHRLEIPISKRKRQLQ
jgi:hypothetical protein